MLALLSARPEGPTDARGPKGRERGGALGERAASLGECCKLPSEVQGVAPENFEFCVFWDLKIASKQCSWPKMMVFN